MEYLHNNGTRTCLHYMVCVFRVIFRASFELDIVAEVSSVTLNTVKGLNKIVEG